MRDQMFSAATIEEALALAARTLGLPREALETAIGDRLRAPHPRADNVTVSDADLLRRTRELHQELLSDCVLRNSGVAA